MDEENSPSLPLPYRNTVVLLSPPLGVFHQNTGICSRCDRSLPFALKPPQKQQRCSGFYTEHTILEKYSAMTISSLSIYGGVSTWYVLTSCNMSEPSNKCHDSLSNMQWPGIKASPRGKENNAAAHRQVLSIYYVT